jgi:hypothetical protein
VQEAPHPTGIRLCERRGAGVGARQRRVQRGRLAGMPRFVLLRHECPPPVGKSSHWDLMFEAGEGLVSWSLESLPAAWALALEARTGDAASVVDAGGVVAIRLAEHRLAYLDYEGPVSGGRGEVSRVDRGDYRVVEVTDELFCVDVVGAALEGVVRLERVEGARWALKLGVGGGG